jgi:hypothetical protein
MGLLALGGCGDPLADGSFSPAYVSLSAQLSAHTSATTKLNVALRWENDTSDRASFYEELVTVRLDFPWLKLDVVKLPPSSAIHAVPAGASFAGIDNAMQWAKGTLIVYSDDNGDGQLDLVDANGGPSLDRVLAAVDDVAVFYLAAGAPADVSWAGAYPVARGFSLARRGSDSLPMPGDCGGFDAFGHWSRRCTAVTSPGAPLDIATPIALMLVDDPALQRYACAEFWGGLEYPDWYRAADQPCITARCPCSGYQCPLDVPPAGTPVVCNSDGTAYVYKTCADDASLCGTRFCHYGHGERRPTDPVPAGWPSCS